jgi:hypothetical protein
MFKLKEKNKICRKYTARYLGKFNKKKKNNKCYYLFIKIKKRKRATI